jgi:hypothetical protein
MPQNSVLPLARGQREQEVQPAHLSLAHGVSLGDRGFDNSLDGVVVRNQRGDVRGRGRQGRADGRGDGVDGEALG